MDPIRSNRPDGRAVRRASPGATALIALAVLSGPPLAALAGPAHAASPGQAVAAGPACLASSAAATAPEPLCELGEDPGAAPPSTGPRTRTGNPIDLVTGAKSQTEIDFAVRGAPLGFRRHYLSAGARDDAGLGHGWRHTWLVSLAATADGGRRIVDSTGRHVFFDPPADGVATGGAAPARFPARSAPDGHLVETADGHAWVVPDGRRLSFRGPYLVRIDWPGHRFVALEWSRHGPRRATDETGRAIELEYAAATVGLAEYGADGLLDLPGHLSAVVLPGGGRIEYGYDAAGNLVRARFPDGTSRVYHYENARWPNRLTGLTERTGARFATWTYDDDGLATSSSRPGGVEAVELSREAPAEPGGVGTTTAMNADGRTSVYAWRVHPTTGAALLLSSRGAGCSTCPPTGRDYAYDEDGLLASATFLDDALAPIRTVRHERDALGRILRTVETDPFGAERTLERREYADGSSVPVRTWRPSANPDGERLVETVPGADGLVAAVVERGFAPDVAGLDGAAPEPLAWTPIERTTTLRRDALGRIVAVDGPREDVEDVTRLEWDARSRLVAVHPPASPATRVLSFDAAGRPVEVRIGTASPLRIERDARGDVVAVEHLGRRHAYEHDAEGRLVATVDPDGRRTTFEHDRAGRPRRSVDDLGRTVTLTLDEEGRTTRVRLANAAGDTVRALAYAHDAYGRVAAEARLRRDPETGESRERRTDYARDRLGRLSGIVDAATGASISIELDALARLATLTLPDGTSSAIELDALGRDVAFTDARDNRTRRLRDDFGRTVLLDSPDAGLEVRTHDAAGNVLTRTRDGAVTTYVHDAANRLVRRENADGASTWRHDPANGRLVEMANATTVETFAHDAEGRTIEHVRRIDGLELVTRHAWGERGRLVGRVLPDGQRLRRHYRDGAVSGVGALRAVTRSRLFGLREETVLGEIDSDARDGSAGHLAPGGLRVRRTFDAQGDLESLEVADALALEYRFDDVGRIVGIAEDGAAQRFGYRAGRLTRADTLSGSYRYAYDAAGNRTERRADRADGTRALERYEYPAAGEGNRLLRAIDTLSGASEAYAYAPGGAPAAIGALRYEHDLERRPVAVYRDGTLLARYAYNPYGERVRKTVLDAAGVPTVTYFLYEDRRLLAEVDGGGEVIAQYLYLDGHRPVARLAGNEVHAIHADHLGAPRLMTDRDGEVVWRARWSPFGEAEVTLAAVDLPLRLPGQYADAETGTHYNYLRDYDPATGRYLTSDPIGLGGGPNTYAYVGGDPLSGVDPFGLYLVAFDGTGNKGSESNTNVYQMALAYGNGDVDYHVGVGTGGPIDKYITGGMFGVGARKRVDLAISRLKKHLETSSDTNIDIIGFSRGSAIAREFANRITEMQANGEFAQPFTIRFMGLYDTVATNLVQDNGDEMGFGQCTTYDLSIPDSVEYVAHATAVDEFRPLFPLSSIEEDPATTPSNQIRVEAGFIGAHSDVGGGYAGTKKGSDGGDLSDVSLVWMTDQARLAGVEFILTTDQRTVSRPIVHDQRLSSSRGMRTDREVQYPDDPGWVRSDRWRDEQHPYERIEQRDMPDYEATRRFMKPDGTVDMAAYAAWLKARYGITVHHTQVGANP